MWGPTLCPQCGDTTLRPSTVTTKGVRKDQDHTVDLFSGLDMSDTAATYIMLARTQSKGRLGRVFFQCF